MSKIPFIEFFENEVEQTIPCIRLTKSRNGQTGTATFLFFNPTSFHSFFEEKKLLLNLHYNNNKISSENINLYFKNGKPIIIKVIFLFKNEIEWFLFLKFMFCYSQEKGLSFFKRKIQVFDT